MRVPSKIDRRVQFDVLPERLEELDAMMEEADIRTRKELFDNAFTLLQWALEVVKSGESVASYNKESDRVETIRLPILEAAARRARASNRTKVTPVTKTEGKDNATKKTYITVAS